MAGYQFTGMRELPAEFWDGVSTDAPAPLEDGIYEAECVKADAMPTKKDGKPSIKCTFKIIGSYDSSDELNRTCFDNFTFEQEGAFKVKNFCEAANVDLPSSTYVDELERLAEDMVGEKVWVDLGTREYKGRKNNTIIRYISQGDVDEYVKEMKKGERGTGDRPNRKSRAERAREAEQKKGESEAAARAEKRKARKSRDEEEEDDPPPQRERSSSRANGKASSRAAETEDLDDDDEDGADDAPPPEEENPRRVNRRRGRRAE